MKTRGQIKDRERREDISEGKEKHPIPVYGVPLNVPLPNFAYITEHSTRNTSYPPRDRLPFKGCSCEEKCDPKSCECIIFSKEINEILECNESCNCGESCKNRKCSNFIMPKMYLQYGNSAHGFGVFADEKIAKNTIVALYAGEVCEIMNHIKLADSDYTYRIESKVSKKEIEIDGTHRSNIARFFNHSCNPNMKTKTAYLGKHRMPYPVFIAIKTIRKHEEFLIDYGDRYFSLKGITCKCGECNEDIIL
uniref:SET domain-containing protein n=1 Tax=Panagrolaimus sp. ES5 TaxID=591445 RepID=A0AC34F497_9BILA